MADGEPRGMETRPMFDDISSFDGQTDGPILQRARGRGACTFKVRDGHTVLDTLGQSGSFKVRLPKLPKGSVPEAVLLNTAGGLTGGDRMSFTGRVAAGGHAVYTTQACERAYRSLSGDAFVETRLSAGADATLEWLPQETILFDGARLRRTFDVDLAVGATLLAHETVVFGRTAMGEAVTDGAFRDTWRVRRDGRLVHADVLCVDGEIDAVNARAATLRGAKAMSTIVYIGDDATACLDDVRAVLDGAGGASGWDGKLVCRIVAADSAALRNVVIPVLNVLRDGRAMPRVWSI